MATATQTGSTSATDEAKVKANEAGERIQGAAGQAQDKLHDAADQAREQAGKATDQAKGRVREQVDQRSTEFAGRAKGTADDLRTVGDQLREQGKDQPARLADQAAGRIEDAAGYLERADADQLLSDLEDFGRKRPWAVIAGGLAVGFAASRLLKTSSSQRYQRAQPGRTGAGTASSTGTSNALPRGTATPGAGVDVGAAGTSRPTPGSTSGAGLAGTSTGAAGTTPGVGAAGTTTRTGGAATSGPSAIPTTSSPLDDLADRAAQQEPRHGLS